MLYKNKLIRQLLQKRVLRGAMTMLFIVAAMPLWAQYNDIRYLTNSAAKLVQIDCEDDATLLYFTYDNTRPNTYLYVSDAIRLKVGGIDYYLKGAGNMPVSHDGGDKSVTGRAGKRLNFVLAFDKVPIDKPFDLIENELSTTAFNFHAIKVNTQLRTRRYDIDVFLEDTHIKHRNVVNVGGSRYNVWKCRGLTLTMHSMRTGAKGDDIKVMLDIVNNTGRSINFSTDDLNIIAYKKKKEVALTMPVADNNGVGNSVRRWDDYEALLADEDEPRRKTSTRISTLDVLSRYAVTDNNAVFSRYLQQLKTDLSDRTLVSRAIDNGECHGGMFTLDAKKSDYITIVFTLDGESYRYKIIVNQQ